jgi:predicted Fe-Mo cluster-binding NifX family protein
MRIAIPLTDGKLSQHFGHCEQFSIIDFDDVSKTILNQQILGPPEHQPGVLPKWLSQLQVGLVIAGGIGSRAQQLFAQKNIKVLCGAGSDDPESIVKDYLAGNLDLGENVCDH